MIWISLHINYYDKFVLYSVKRLIEKENNPDMFGQQRVECTDEYISSKKSGVETKAKWSSIHRIAEEDNYLFVYTKPLEAIIIPKDKLSKEDKDIIEFIRSKKQLL